MNNVIQLPYRKLCEPYSDYELRRDRWREQKGWITCPIEPPTPDMRKRLAEQQAESVLPPLFAAARRRA